MKILLVHDDGVHAHGINCLFEALSTVHQVVMVAPLEERSATSHTISLDQPLRLVTVLPNQVYGLSGFPADCAHFGISYLQKKLDLDFDIVVSGVNRGANLGTDVYYSGTVGAAREGAFRGKPAIAVSLCSDFTHPDKESYKNASLLIKKILQLFEGYTLRDLFPLRSVLNINVPLLPDGVFPGLRQSYLGVKHYGEEILERKDFKGREYFWIGGTYLGHGEWEGSDCQNLSLGYVPVTLLQNGDPKKSSGNQSDYTEQDFLTKEKRMMEILTTIKDLH